MAHAGRGVIMVQRSTRTNPRLGEGDPSFLRTIVVWREKRRFMLAYLRRRKQRKPLICILGFETEGQRSVFIRGLGRRDIVPTEGDPAAIRNRLLLMFGGRRDATRQPVEIYKGPEGQRETLVFVTWASMSRTSGRLEFMLATGTKESGLRRTQAFGNELERQSFLRTVTTNPRVIRIQGIRDLSPPDLNRHITGYRSPSARQGSSAKQVSPGVKAVPLSPLTGEKLLAKYKELDGQHHTEIARQCGYQRLRADGTYAVNNAGFFEALKRAKLAESSNDRSKARVGKPRIGGFADGHVTVLSSSELARLPKRGGLSPAALRRRENLRKEQLKEEERREKARIRKENRDRERRRLFGLDEPDAPEDAMRIAWLCGSPGQGKRA